MKFRSLLLLLSISFILTACFSHHYNVGKGVRVEKTTEVEFKNKFMVWGIIPIKRAKIDQMVGDTINYHVYTRATPEDMIVSALTLGIYTPTTTTVIIPAERFKRSTNRRIRRKD